MSYKFRKGDRVRYTPHHAGGNPYHKDCQDGVVSSTNDRFVFVKYDTADCTMETGDEDYTAQATEPRELQIWWSEMDFELRNGDSEKIIRQIEDFIIGQMYKFDKKKSSVVVGLSGGADSTLVAAITKRAFDRAAAEGRGKFELFGLCMPSSANRQADLVDGMAVASRLEIPCRVIDIQPIVAAHLEGMKEELSKFDQGNMMSRIRANILSTFAAKKDGYVIGTGNNDEDEGVGYYTLFGDGAVHFSPIGDLPKRIVFQLLKHLGFMDAAFREPTAGLEPGQSDFRDLGYSYDFVEVTLQIERYREAGNDPYKGEFLPPGSPIGYAANLSGS